MELILNSLASARRLQSALLLTASLAAVPVLYLFNPAQSRLFPPCPLRWLTGWQCPGCGSLRAVHQLLHGECAAAWAFNPLLLLMLPLLVFLLGQQFRILLGPPAREMVLPASWTWGLLLLTLAWTVARNLPA